MHSDGNNKTSNSEKIYFRRPHIRQIDTSKHFLITEEHGNLRVVNKNVNVLFQNLNRKDFDKIYNDFYQSLNLDFEPLQDHDKEYFLSDEEQDKLIDKIITWWIYFYNINNMPIQLDPSDFSHPSTLDQVLVVLDKKYGKDSPESLALGAKILRKELDNHIATVQGRRRYYDK